ncbi:MAG TPA: lysophospholipid acyltransferase family protein [Ktedonobacteraceae bacterium]|nr:lysophospholipid acyltransferase family protein [Ktedonobacteraceae bacterium]
MKQDVSADGAAASSAQEPPRKKPAKNYYEPYATPRVLYELIRYLARFIVFLIARVHLRGLYNVPRRGPYILASNHLSWMDVPLVPAYVPGKVVYMAKEELFYGKVWWITRFLGAFPVKRGEGDRQALRTADELLKKKKVLVIFPEGTRSKTHTLAKGHAGLGMIALRAGVPVVPVAIWGSEHVLKKFGAEVTISYGAPFVLKPKGAKVTREDIADATEEIMRRIASMLPPQYRGEYGSAPTRPQNQEA